jgi:hypothetical protein
VFADGAYHAIRAGLVELSLVYSGSSWGQDILGPWMRAHPAVVAALRVAGEPGSASVALGGEDLWALYAVHRLVEFLTSAYQPAAPSDDDEPFDHLPEPAALAQFVAAVGGTWPARAAFHPFLHEIVAAVPAQDPEMAPELVRQWWPGCFVGSLLLARAGVTVRAGSRWLQPAVAGSSTLYWAWRRRHRPVADLSHGWGHNSQWRTAFRRDYLLDGVLRYNVDAAQQPEPDRDDPDLPPGADVELLRYRCSTTVDHGPDVWIWDTHHTEPNPGLATGDPPAVGT